MLKFKATKVFTDGLVDGSNMRFNNFNEDNSVIIDDNTYINAIAGDNSIYVVSGDTFDKCIDLNYLPNPFSKESFYNCVLNLIVDFNPDYDSDLKTIDEDLWLRVVRLFFHHNTSNGKHNITFIFPDTFSRDMLATKASVFYSALRNVMLALNNTQYKVKSNSLFNIALLKHLVFAHKLFLYPEYWNKVEKLFNALEVH